jgi:hypothetical protein
MTTLLIIAQSPDHAKALLRDREEYQRRSVDDSDVIVVTNNDELEALPEFDEKPIIEWIGSPQIDRALYKQKTHDK